MPKTLIIQTEKSAGKYLSYHLKLYYSSMLLIDIDIDIDINCINMLIELNKQ